MAAQNMPAAEVDVDTDLVRRLLAGQHPDLAELPLRPLANGWDNTLFRLGDDLLVRLPRRQLGADLVANELRWLPQLAPQLPLPIPAPVRAGDPSDDYPWAWTICPYVDGVVAADAVLRAPSAEAARLGEFVAALHVEAPPDAPVNPVRGHPVADLDERFDANVDRAAGVVDVGRLRARWDDLSGVDEWGGPPLWIHGDLHTANVIVDDGEIVAVVDFGDITAADPAVDLAIAWMLFDADDRRRFRLAAGATVPVDDATWQRAELWAMHFAVLYLVHSADNERFERMGRHLVGALLG